MSNQLGQYPQGCKERREFPAWLKRKRAKAGLSRPQLSKIIGVSDWAIARYEGGYILPRDDVRARLKEWGGTV